MRFLSVRQTIWTAPLLLAAFAPQLIRADDPPGVTPPKLEGKLVCVGDSITAGEGVKPAESYVGLIKAAAAADGLKLEVVNEGRSGWSTGAFANSRAKVLKAMPSDATVVTVFLGTNDAHEDGTPDAVAKKAGENLTKLIDMYHEKSPAARFVIVSPTRIYPEVLTQRLKDAHYGEKSEADLKQIAVVYKQIAQKRGLVFLDLGELPSSSKNSIDGVHPNAEGHREIFDALWKSMTAAPATTQP